MSVSVVATIAAFIRPFIEFIFLCVCDRKAIAGLLADGRQIVETARKEAINYRQQFDRPIPIKVLNDRISSFIHAYTLYSAVRPFGISIILASYSPETGPQMYMIEPSGSSYVSLRAVGGVENVSNK